MYKIIHETKESEFEKKINDLATQGWKLINISIGITAGNYVAFCAALEKSEASISGKE